MIRLLFFILFTLNLDAHANTQACNIKISGTSEASLQNYAITQLQNNCKQACNAGAQIHLNYCENCGYYGEGYVLSVEFYDASGVLLSQKASEYYSVNDPQAMILSFIRNIEYCF